MSPNDPVLKPLRLNNLVLKNRIYSTGHAPSGYLDGGAPSLRYELYHEEKAKGGIALTIIGGSSNVAADSANVFDQIDAGDDAILPFYRSISHRMHRHGAAVMIQLTHLGRRSKWDIGRWLPAVAPSAVRERAHRSFPKVIDRFDIDRIVTAYGAAARRAREGGLDGIEIAAMAGHLIDQFWSPRTNQRTDEFGGSLENRLRFGQMVLQEIRDQVGSDFVVGMRIPGDEGVRDGLGASDCVGIATAVARTGMVDFLSVVYGSGHTDRELSEMIPVFGRPLGAHVSVAGAIREQVGIPIFHAGRIADLSTARHAIEGGHADMVGMTRAHIADPHIVAKLMAGEEDRIRPCVGATYCASRVETFCLHNPATGREAVIPQVVTSSEKTRRVVVVGGGPGGLEASRVLAERGHHVTLLEAASQLGGQVLLASRTPRHAEKAGIIYWLVQEVRRRGVAVRLGCLAEPADVLALRPDVVVVATGGLPNTAVLESGEDLVVPTWDVLGQAPRPGRRVLIFDDHGGEQALTAAERLACAGVQVEVVTPDRMVGADVTGTLYPDYLRALYSSGAVLTPDHVLRSVRREDGQLVATLANAYSDAVVERAVDQVVVEHGTLPVDGLYDALRAGSRNGGDTDLAALVEGRTQDRVTHEYGAYHLFRIGDAVSHRNLHAAILDARRLCMSL
ncbi:N-methylproline demethylase [Streptomyces antnestii]|uniref:N-methylproline demethylase n=1 Tax=Streptomyces antnestii TaxID=2494256 RepID=A0A437Q3G5_9ACTN|nr:NADH:flavin oxidoreductase [Streptomyces sp. San01]RVU29064.1 N-methylproline demethylase [Streptomyces sp. San01]